MPRAVGVEGSFRFLKRLWAFAHEYRNTVRPKLPSPRQLSSGAGLDEGLESLEEALHELGRDLGLSQHLFESKLVSPFHDWPLSRLTTPWKSKMQEWLGQFNPRETVEIITRHLV